MHQERAHLRRHLQPHRPRALQAAQGRGGGDPAGMAVPCEGNAARPETGRRPGPDGAVRQA
eukprot:8407477-Alexandrium_andersonii.AAC.1